MQIPKKCDFKFEKDIKKDPEEKKRFYLAQLLRLSTNLKILKIEAIILNTLIKKLIFMENKSYYNNFVYDWWKNLDKTILFLIIALIVLGIFFSLVSTSLIASSKLGTNNYYFFLRHLTYIFLSLILIVFFCN